MNYHPHTDNMKRKCGGALLRALLGMGVFCAMAASLHAEYLPDPTRPPMDVYMSSGARHDRGMSSTSGLRSIIISDTRRAAIIDGRTVELGGRLGNATLVEVNPGSVVLQRGGKREELSLFPGVRISHPDNTGAAPSGMEPAPADNGATPDHELKPSAEEKNLSVHPKEEK